MEFLGLVKSLSKENIVSMTKVNQRHKFCIYVYLPTLPGVTNNQNRKYKQLEERWKYHLSQVHHK